MKPNWFNSLFVLLLCVLITGLGFWSGKIIIKPTLRSLMEPRHKYNGTAVGSSQILRVPAFRSAVLREYDIITTGNALKFGPLSPRQGEYDFSEADAIVQFAEQNGITVKGHVLIWSNQLPKWLTEREWTRDELISILREHIHTVVERYRGRIKYWDVVNEAMGDDGKLGDNIFLRTIGPDYIDLAFQWAHEADPEAILFYNQHYAEDMGLKSNAVYDLMKVLIQRGVPIGGVGLETHTGVGWSPDPEEVATNMKRLGDLGLEVQISEMDVRLKLPSTEQQLLYQAMIYRDIFAVCMAAPNCSAFITWGVGDRDSWIPDFYPGFGAALILDENYQRKPAYQQMLQVLQSK